MANSEAPRLTCSLHPTIPLVLHTAPPYQSRDFVCDLCFKVGEGPTYHCKTCKYGLHPTCCTLQPMVRSCAHDHSLTLMPAHHYATSRKKCDGCQHALAGSEWSYRCEPCNFDVHARCAKLREKIVTSFHPYPLKLLKKSPYPPRHLQCDLCGERMPTHGWVYHCTNCKFDLHPECALLPPRPALLRAPPPPLHLWLPHVSRQELRLRRLPRVRRRARLPLRQVQLQHSPQVPQIVLPPSLFFWWCGGRSRVVSAQLYHRSEVQAHRVWGAHSPQRCGHEA